MVLSVLLCRSATTMVQPGGRTATAGPPPAPTERLSPAAHDVQTQDGSVILGALGWRVGVGGAG